MYLFSPCFSPVTRHNHATVVTFLITLVLFCLPVTILAGQPKAPDLVRDGQQIDLQQAKYQALFRELEQRYRFSPQELKQIFKNQVLSRRMLELMDSQWESKPYYKYYSLFITRKNIAADNKQLQDHNLVLCRENNIDPMAVCELAEAYLQ